LEETKTLNDKLEETPLDLIVELVPDQGEPYSNPRRYRQLVSKKNYLTNLP